MKEEEERDENYYVLFMLKTISIVGLLIILLMVPSLMCKIWYVNPTVLGVAETAIKCLLGLDAVVVLYCSIRTAW